MPSIITSSLIFLILGAGTICIHWAIVPMPFASFAFNFDLRLPSNIQIYLLYYPNYAIFHLTLCAMFYFDAEHFDFPQCAHRDDSKNRPKTLNKK